MLRPATDGSRWYADDVPLKGRVNMVLKPLDTSNSQIRRRG
jgi:hypothetical protein